MNILDINILDIEYSIIDWLIIKDICILECIYVWGDGCGYCFNELLIFFSFLFFF